MSDANRTADSAYYASKQTLNIRGTREGSKKPKAAPSYQHVTSDANTSADKYYASAQSPGPAPKAQSKENKQVELTYGKKPVVETVIEELAAGATNIRVSGTAEEVRQAQTAVDIAVGRNTLTREQADSVSYQAQAAKAEAVTAPAADAFVAVESEPEKTEADEAITTEDVAAVFKVEDDDSDA